MPPPKQLLNAPDHCSACGEPLDSLLASVDQCRECRRMFCGACCADAELFVAPASPDECGTCVSCAAAPGEREPDEVMCAGCREMVDAHTAQLERCAQCRARFCHFCVHIDRQLTPYATADGDALCGPCMRSSADKTIPK
jgi:hypothetical protein